MELACRRVVARAARPAAEGLAAVRWRCDHGLAPRFDGWAAGTSHLRAMHGVVHGDCAHFSWRRSTAATRRRRGGFCEPPPPPFAVLLFGGAAEIAVLTFRSIVQYTWPVAAVLLCTAVVQPVGSKVHALRVSRWWDGGKTLNQSETCFRPPFSARRSRPLHKAATFSCSQSDHRPPSRSLSPLSSARLVRAPKRRQTRLTAPPRSPPNVPHCRRGRHTAPPRPQLSLAARARVAVPPAPTTRRCRSRLTSSALSMGPVSRCP